MARDTVNDAPIETKDQLVSSLSDGNKPPEKWRIGTEHEKFGFYTADNSPVPYEGPRGIEALLTGMQKRSDWEPILDAGEIIGLVAPDGMGAISLEPGGQFELSGAPLENLHETCAESNRHLTQVPRRGRPTGHSLFGHGEGVQNGPLPKHR